jgi:hypothetical protein
MEIVPEDDDDNNNESRRVVAFRNKSSETRPLVCAASRELAYECIRSFLGLMMKMTDAAIGGGGGRDDNDD